MPYVSTGLVTFGGRAGGGALGCATGVGGGPDEPLRTLCVCFVGGPLVCPIVVLARLTTADWFVTCAQSIPT